MATKPKTVAPASERAAREARAQADRFLIRAITDRIAALKELPRSREISRTIADLQGLIKRPRPHAAGGTK